MFLNFSLFSLAATASAILGVCANPHGAHLNRHQGIAKRATGNVQLHKRFSDARWTFYDVGMGACGKNNVASDFIVALNSAQFGSGYPAPNCFVTITMSYGGKTTTATIMDECPGCPYGGLDLSRGLFQFFAPESAGVINGEWSFNSGGGGGNTPAAPEPTSTWQPEPTTTWTPEPTTTWKPEPTTTWSPPATPTTTWTPPLEVKPTTTWQPDPTTTSTWKPDPTTPTTTWTPPQEVKPTTTSKPDPTTTSTWKPDPTTPTTTPATTHQTSTVQSSSAPVPSSSASHSSASLASSSSQSASSSAPSPTGKNIVNLDEILVLLGSVIVAAAGVSSDGSAAAALNYTPPK